MIMESIKAALLGALPVACFTFLTVQWSIVSGRLPRFTDAADLQAQFKRMRKEAKSKAKQKKQVLNPDEADEPQQDRWFFNKRKGGDIFHSKLLFFGGGFYGTMAVFTYLIIEVEEILRFLGKMIDITTWHFTFSFQFLVDLIINSIMNLVAAFIWFRTLPNYVDMNNGLIWLAAAYLGYLGGVYFTQRYGDAAWQFLSTRLQNNKLGNK
ncbi:hypothetical protein QX776_18350 [Alteromonadaceae bacterium BrNp21-10]|nr:hypothetical protein [Alteromonadaceae bacterium BrNp21-10]